MRQWIRRFVDFIKQVLRDLFGIGVDVIPGAPAAPTKVESPPTRVGPGEPELGLASPERPQYRKRASLLTYREREFFRVLIGEVGNEHQIFAKVRLWDFVYLANEPTDRKHHNNQIQCKHVDFLLCDKRTQQPLMAIELDDSSHGKYDRRESDDFKSRVFADTGLRLLRVKVQHNYPQGAIGNQVRSKMQEAQSAG